MFPHISQKNKKAKDSLIQWKSENERAYAKFIEEVGRAKDGDYSTYIKIFEMASGCIPKEVMDECKSLFNKEEHNQKPYYEEVIDIFMDFRGFIKISLTEDGSEAYAVSEKDADDKTSYYIPVKGKEEWWNSIPFMYKMLAGMFIKGKTDEELCNHARRIMIVAMLTMPYFIDRLKVRTVEHNDPFMYCVLYWITFDHGIKQSLQILSKVLASPQSIGALTGLIPIVMGKMTGAGISGATETKAELKAVLNEESNTDAKREISLAIAETKGQHGKRRTESVSYDIKEHLTGNASKMIKLIREFRKDHDCIIHITYLFKAMDDAKCLKGINLSMFFHCIEQLEGKKYNMDKAKRYYNQMLGKNSDYEKSKSSRWLMARRIVEHWTEVFKDANDK